MRITTAERQQVWLAHLGQVFSSKCTIPWCTNTITVFDFHVGHNVPKSNGGTNDLSNLLPVCKSCNLSMSNKYTIDAWSSKHGIPKQKVITQIGPSRVPHVDSKRRWCCWIE